MLTVTSSGDDTLAARFDAFPDALRGALAAKAETLAQTLVDTIKSDKLSGQLLNARSGALRDSIGADVTSDDDGVVAAIGSFGDVKYAAIQEYGGHTAAHEILPSKSRVLAFVAGGAMRFAARVEHPGSTIPAHAYLGSALEDQSDAIIAALAATPAESWESA